MSNHQSILTATAVLLLGGLGLYAVKSSRDSGNKRRRRGKIHDENTENDTKGGDNNGHHEDGTNSWFPWSWEDDENSSENEGEFDHESEEDYSTNSSPSDDDSTECGYEDEYNAPPSNKRTTTKSKSSKTSNANKAQTRKNNKPNKGSKRTYH